MVAEHGLAAVRLQGFVGTLNLDGEFVAVVAQVRGDAVAPPDGALRADVRQALAARAGPVEVEPRRERARRDAVDEVHRRPEAPRGDLGGEEPRQPGRAAPAGGGRDWDGRCGGTRRPARSPVARQGSQRPVPPKKLERARPSAQPGSRGRTP